MAASWALAPATVAAQPAAVANEPDPRAPTADRQSADERAEARRLTAEGIAAQDRGDYATAVARYQHAYRLVPHPLLLFNLGQAFRLAGNPRGAAESYERYLEADPSGDKAQLARDHIRRLRAAFPEAFAPREVVPAPPSASPVRPEPVSPPPAVDEDDTAKTPVQNRGRALRIVGMGVAVAGVAAAGAGAWYGWRARGISDELTNHRGPWTDELLDRQADGETAERRMIILTAAGAATVVTGAILYWRGRRMRGSAAAVAITPDQVGLLVQGRF